MNVPAKARRKRTAAGGVAALAAALVLAALTAPAVADELNPAEAAKKSPQWAAEKAKMIALGKQYPTAWAFYQDLKKKAGGGQRLSWDKMPDWTGVYTRAIVSGGYGLVFDTDQDAVPTAKYTPEYHKRLMKTLSDQANGIEYDPLSQCHTPTYPRWHTLPFLREFIVTPDQTTLISEAFNTVRRIYTDGRDHMPEADRYPLELGDSIGFWDGERLIIHTNQNWAHMYERGQGEYSDEVETVEIWRKVSDRVIEADVWVYDPPALAEPWYARQRQVKLSNPDKSLRIRHWSCKGNPNNDVIETSEGGSQFREFTFEKKE